MRFRVKVTSTRLTKLNGQDAVEVDAVSLQDPGKVTVTVPLADAGDYKSGDIVIAEVRTRRQEEA